MDASGQQRAKEAVGLHLATMVENGMCLGLGTGTTAALAIQAIGVRVKEEGLIISGVPTSFASERIARDSGIGIRTLDDVAELDLAFDGADEVDPRLNLIKGGGAAHTREKVVAGQAKRFVVLVDDSKRVDILGTRSPVPVEVIPMAVAPVMRALQCLGAICRLRMALAKQGPVVTDLGMWLIDARFDGIPDPADMDTRLNAIPGIIEHGLFVGMTTELLVGSPDTVIHEIA